MDSVVNSVHIGDREIGAGHPCYLVAEAGVNHNGDIDLAHDLVVAAAEAGADAVKFQTFRAEALATPDSPKAGYQLQTTAPSQSQLAMLKSLELPFEAFPELAREASLQNIGFLSSPFDEESADLLDSIEPDAIKIPSGEITNIPLLRHIGEKKRPIILSTGMANLEEVEAALKAIDAERNGPVILLHCVSTYPATPSDMNLRAMKTMANAFSCPVGLSDHSEGIVISIAAAALGAAMIERHLTLDRTFPGPDHQASLEPNEFREMVLSIRSVEQAMGDGLKEPRPNEIETAAVARKSVVAAQDIRSGTQITKNMLAIKRPGTGIPPSQIDSLIGRRALTDISEGTLLTDRLVE